MSWPYRASVIAHAKAEIILTRLPQQRVIEPIDANKCRAELSADTPQVLAAWLGMLGVDFDIENREEHPEPVEHLRQIAERYQRVAGSAGRMTGVAKLGLQRTPARSGPVFLCAGSMP